MAVCFGNSRLPVWRLKGRQMVKVAVMASALMAGQVAALAPEHEARRLMLAIEEAVTEESWGEAGEYLNRLQLLEAEKPVDYHYYRGKVMLQSSHFNEAQSALEAYVTKAGTEGEHYQDALKLLTNIERERKAKAQAPKTSSDTKIAVIEPAGDSRLESLRKLYLAGSDREALVLHLNSLLGTAAWREDQGVVRLDKRPDIEYRVNVSGNAIAVQEIKRNSAGGATRTTAQVQVFGVNPQVEWGCEPAVATCWVYDPRDGSRLFQLAPNRTQVEEVAQTLGKLIRNLQVPSGS
ncbi:tetratricopeptide repeat protein [Marinobacter sp.]|uniref:tetratricopeptide repeat protein n=1 Tax=Marinobacter sp. TaxID=50741 RepID=UPI003A8FFCBA